MEVAHHQVDVVLGQPLAQERLAQVAAQVGQERAGQRHRQVGGGQRQPGELFAVLAGLSDDPAFLGYPYPLARAHQVVSLPGHLLADLRRDLREAFLREGLSEDDVDLVMRDFHLTLNA